MFKNYVVILGDTPQKIARKELGDPSKAGIISKVNGLPSGDSIPIIPGIVIKIPDTKDSDLSSPITFDTDTGGLKELSINIDNNKLELFDRLVYVERLAGFRGGGISCDYDPINEKLHRESFKFGRDFSLIANREKIMTGYTMTPAPIYTPEKSGISLLFKSTIHTMIVSDIAPDNFPLEFTAGQTLKQIAGYICGLFGINVTVDSTVSNITFNDGDNTGVSVGVTENALAFLIRICQSRGVLIRDTADGGLFIFRAIDKPPIASFIDGETDGLEGIIANYNYENLAKNYGVFSQYGSNAVFGSAENKLFPLNIFKNINELSVSSGIASEIAKWKMLRELGQAVKIKIPIGDWYTPEKVRYAPGEFIDIQSPKNGIFERQTLIIEGIELNLSKNQYGAMLFCTIPEAYTGLNVSWLPMI